MSHQDRREPLPPDYQYGDAKDTETILKRSFHEHLWARRRDGRWCVVCGMTDFYPSKESD